MRSAVREQGSISPLVVGGILVLAAMALGGTTVGRVAVTKVEVQRAADAAVLAAAKIIRERGLPFDATAQAAAEAIANRNTSSRMRFNWVVADRPSGVDFQCVASVNLEAPRMIVPAGSLTVSASATGTVPQSRFDETTRRLPKFVLVLDYSGSMTATMPGGGGKDAITVLEDNVRGLLDLNLRINYGAVLYSSGIKAAVPVDRVAPARIRDAMNRNGADGMTCTSCGLNRARELLLAAGEDTGRYVLLVSDGAPNNGGGESGARSAARSINNINGTIVTLHIDWSGGRNRSLRNFMISVSGKPGATGNADFYYNATSSATLREAFRRIVSIIACPIGPLRPAPTSSSALRVYLKDATGRETRMEQVAQLDETNARQLVYRYDSADATVRISEAACDAVIDQRHQVVVRHGQVGLQE
ncbi:MAG: VWA domain-containing protein [Deltaproteobacteria bacterium]|nr:VWA domain-containing protein [Deltaproteobacteria bacterium]